MGNRAEGGGRIIPSDMIHEEETEMQVDSCDAWVLLVLDTDKERDNHLVEGTSNSFTASQEETSI